MTPSNNYISPTSSRSPADPLLYLEKKFDLTHEQVQRALTAVGGNKNAVEGFIQKNRWSLVASKND